MQQMKVLLTLATVGSLAACGGGKNGTDAGAGGAGGGTGGGPVDAGQVVTSHGGEALPAWMKAYWQWSLSGAAADAGRRQDVIFLPLPDGSPLDGGVVYAGTLSITLTRADSFAVPLYAYTGERYLADSGIPDDPTNAPPDSDYTGTSQALVLTLDGVKLIDSSRDSLTPYFYPAQSFDMPIRYPAPTTYGAIAAIWNKGLGILHTPLPPGAHTLHLEEFNSTQMFGYSNTWNITVP